MVEFEGRILMIYIRTCAYNAEKTLERTIDSVLSQTYRDFRWYLLDNGSTDSTGDIIRKYAELDNRIVAFYNKVNRNYMENPRFLLLTKEMQEEDYFCVIDADDTYDATFIEDMLKFSVENQLDIACCGTRMIDVTTGEVCGQRMLSTRFILSDEESFGNCFPEIHWNLRQTWGKLYTAKAISARFEDDIPEWFPKAYGGDTINVYECVRASERIGALNKVLHSYYISPRSVSYKWIDGREIADFTLFEKAQELLIQKCGYVSPRNLNFLYAVQFNALRDTLRVLFGSDLSPERKVEILKGIFENSITQQTFYEEGNVREEEKTQLLTEVVCGIIELAQKVEKSSLPEIADIYKVFNTDFTELIPTEVLGWYMEKLPVLVRNVVLREYEYAVNNLLVYFAKENGIECETDAPIVLGQMLASLRNEEAKYVYFSKQMIHWCIRNNRLEQARRDLDEWLQILPEDQDFIKLKQMCE